MRSKNHAYIQWYGILISFLTLCCGCHPNMNHSSERIIPGRDWKTVLQKELPLLGHRNWILVVDKAFPALNAPGMQVIYADENLLGVLRYTLNRIDSSSHVSPIIYVDKEMQYLTPQLEKGIDSYRDSLREITGNRSPHPVLHDSVFTSIQHTSSLFKVLVIKTNETRAYSSVFLQLDCAYWNADKEKLLRQAMPSQ